MSLQSAAVVMDFESQVIKEQVTDPLTGKMSERISIRPRDAAVQNRLNESFKRLWKTPVTVA